VSGFSRPASAMASFAAFLAYQHDTWYPQLEDMRAVEGLLRSQVVIRLDGSLEDRIPAERPQAHLAAMWADKPRDYRAVKCPVLAIYGQTFYDLHIRDESTRASLTAWESRYWAPFQAKSMARVKRELPRAQVIHIP